MFKHGVVAGKFYPLHKGHDLLITNAGKHCEKLSIFVVWLDGQDPDGETRYQAVKRAYPFADVHKVVDLCTNDGDPESSKHWAQYTWDILDGEKPDAVFSSEQYGVWWANELGATHVPLSFNRTYWPISGTEIRNDPYANFHMIHDELKSHYVKRVLVVGAESTGKTTLCKNLAQAYSTVFVPEYGRAYVEDRGLDKTDRLVIFAEIMNRQQKLEESYVKDANRVLFCDTDLLTTSLWWNLWQEGNFSPLERTIYNEGLKHLSKYDLVLLMDDEDTTWVDDGMRDQEHTRKAFTKKLWNLYTGANVTTVATLNGPLELRASSAMFYINDNLFQKTKALLPGERLCTLD